MYWILLIEIFWNEFRFDYGAEKPWTIIG